MAKLVPAALQERITTLRALDRAASDCYRCLIYKQSKTNAGRNVEEKIREFLLFPLLSRIRGIKRHPLEEIGLTSESKLHLYTPMAISTRQYPRGNFISVNKQF